MKLKVTHAAGAQVTRMGTQECQTPGQTHGAHGHSPWARCSGVASEHCSPQGGSGTCAVAACSCLGARSCPWPCTR